MAVTANGTLSVISTSSSANTAVIRYVVTCTTTGDSYNNYSQTGTFVIDGTSYTSSYTLPKNTTTTVFSKDVTVSNASDRTISASYSFPTTPSGGTKTGSNSVTVPTIPRYANLTSLSVKSRTVNSITFQFTTDRSASLYARNDTDGTNWLNNGNPFVTNTTSGTFTIYYANRENTTRLTPNKTYSFTILCRDAASGLDTSKTISGTTYQIAQISTANNFNHGDSDSISITNPSGATMSLTMKIGNTTILTKTPSTGANTISFTDSNLDTIYKLYGTGNSLTVTYIVSITVNSQTYTHSKTCTITLKGNQKTARTNVSNSWKRRNTLDKCKWYMEKSSNMDKC